MEILGELDKMISYGCGNLLMLSTSGDFLLEPLEFKSFFII